MKTKMKKWKCSIVESPKFVVGDDNAKPLPYIIDLKNLDRSGLSKGGVFKLNDFVKPLD